MRDATVLSSSTVSALGVTIACEASGLVFFWYAESFASVSLVIVSVSAELEDIPAFSVSST